MILLRVMALALAGMLVHGCASTPPPRPHFYVLDTQAQAIPKSAGKPVAVAAVAVPDYLRQRKLVMRQSSQQIIFANYHSWADDLPAAIRRVLIEELSAASSLYRFVDSCTDCGELQVRVDQFYPTDSGQAVLSGSYSLRTGKGGEQHAQPFYLERPLTDDGYGEAVSQMRQLLQDLSQNIVADNMKK